jgi:hypothetical protein
MLAALNHPTIATIYGLEQSNGTSYLVTEGKGRTLLIPVSEAVFFMRDDRIEFVKDNRGTVTHFTRRWVEGDLKY